MMTTQRDDIIELMNSEHRLREEANRLSAEVITSKELVKELQADNKRLTNGVEILRESLKQATFEGERLSAENTRLQDQLKQIQHAFDIDAETTKRLEAENVRLREALEPLAKLWYSAMANRDDGVQYYGYGDVAITFGDVKRAHEALGGEG